MHLSIAMIRNGLHAISRKLVVEALVSSASTLLAMTILSHMAKPAVPLGPDARPQASVEEKVAAEAANSAIKAFIERVALSALSDNARIAPPSPPVAVAASAVTDTPAPPATVPAEPRRPASAKPRLRTSRPVSRLAVLPPPRPQIALAAITPVAAAAAPAPAKGVPALEHVARLSGDLWDSASSAGALVVDNVASARDRLGAMAKGLM